MLCPLQKELDGFIHVGESGAARTQSGIRRTVRQHVGQIEIGAVLQEDVQIVTVNRHEAAPIVRPGPLLLRDRPALFVVVRDQIDR